MIDNAPSLRLGRTSGTYLTVDIAAYRHRSGHRLDVGLLQQQITYHVTEFLSATVKVNVITSLEGETLRVAYASNLIGAWAAVVHAENWPLGEHRAIYLEIILGQVFAIFRDLYPFIDV